MIQPDDRPDRMLPWLPLPGFIHRLTIAQRVRIGFSVGAVVIVVISLVASVLIRQLTDSLSQVVQRADFEQNTLGAMKDAVSAEDTAVQGYLITGEAASLDTFNAAHDRFIAASTLLQGPSSAAADRTAAQELTGLEAEFRGLAQQEIDLSREGFPNAAAFHWQTEGQHAGQALTNRLDQLSARRSTETHDQLTTAQHTEAATRILFAPIVVITALLALFTALLASNSISRRVERLDKAIEAIEQGDYHVVLTENRGDELGRLARSIRAMARALDVETRARERLLSERARGNEELAALYDLSRTVNQSLDTDEVLRLALAKLLGYTHMGAGLAMLFDESAQVFRLALTEGLSEGGIAEVAGLLDESDAQEFFAAVMAHDGPTHLDLDSLPIETQPFRTAIAVPLRAKGNGRGVLVLATAEQLEISDDEERLIEGLSKQVGTALEHAWLYSKSRQLAAAEERNRLARELHDSVTQSLFSMSMMAQALPSLIERHADRAIERATRLSDLARGALAEMR
ncbi:MAG: histidine kinase, partial [Dehalococcoidia bacterium]